MLFALLAQAAMAPATAPSMPMPAPAACAAPAPLPITYANFAAAQPVTAAAGVGGVEQAMLTVGRGARVTLLPSASLTLTTALQRPLTATQHGGLFAFFVPVAGRYRVALGRGVWIDVVQAGHALPSAAHGHGPDCTPIRKVVEYDLKPGRYVLQIAGDEQPTLALEIVKAV